MTVSEELKLFRLDVNQRFDNVNERFEGVDRQFVGIKQRFEGIDRRFIEVDRRFDKVDLAIAENGHQMKIMFEQMQKTIKDTLIPTQEILKVENRVDNHSSRISDLERDVKVIKLVVLDEK